MAIKVLFDKHGWYHPAYGRLGRGKGTGSVYQLPDVFGERETLTVDVMDSSSRPPRKTGEKTVERFKFLPSTATILDEAGFNELVEEAEAAGEDAPKPVRPPVADKDALDKVTRAHAPVQSAQERTAPARRPSRKQAASTE